MNTIERGPAATPRAEVIAAARALIGLYRLGAGCRLVYRHLGADGRGIGAPDGLLGTWARLERAVEALDDGPRP